MRRLWIGLVVLSLLLVGGCAVSRLFARAHLPAVALLEQAAQAAKENPAHARQLCGQARAQWQRFRRVTAAFADHGPMDEIESLYAQLEQVPAWEVGSLCARLAALTAALAESHSFRWWTVL